MCRVSGVFRRWSRWAAGDAAGRRSASGGVRLAGGKPESIRRIGVPAGAGMVKGWAVRPSRDPETLSAGVANVPGGTGFYIGLSFWYGAMRLISGVRFRWCQAK